MGISLRGEFNNLEDYESFVEETLARHCPRLAVLPGLKFPAALDLHARLAGRLGLYLATTLFVPYQGEVRQRGVLFDPRGRAVLSQEQTHLSALERQGGMGRGTELKVFEADFGRVGFLLGTDCFYPEVGRILALQGAELVLACGRLPADTLPARRLAGVWAQVQQNQFFAVESRLFLKAALYAPCELTAGQTGFLSPEEQPEEQAVGFLDFEALKVLKETYPLLKLLNRQAFGGYLPQIYQNQGDQS